MTQSKNFQVNLRGVIELLSGHLYSGPQVYVRELMQNSVDAISARRMIDPEFRPEISFELMDTSPPTLLVKDNGVGLTESEVHEFLATIGQSSKRDALTRESFIGQFGIGLLSGFMVCDEIVVITRSAKQSDTRPVEWKGRADGTYSVRVLDGDFEPGTQVYLRAKPGSHEFVEPEFVSSMVRHYGSYLPIEITLTHGSESETINETPPWAIEFESEDDRANQLAVCAEEIFGNQFLDYIPIKTEAGGVEGIAFVQRHATNTTGRQSHRVYLKNMLLSEQADKLLPDWAFFVRCVLNVSDLKPTASREALQDDHYLAETRADMGEVIRQWLITLAETDRERLDRIIAVHFLPMKALAVDDDDFFRMFINWLPFETTLGNMTLAEVMQNTNAIRFVTTRDQFRQILGVSAAQDLCIVNAGYVYDRDLMLKLDRLFPDQSVEQVDVSELAQEFTDLTAEEQKLVARFLQIADETLEPYQTAAEIKKFAPSTLPTLYTANDDATFMRSVEQTRENTDELWSGILGDLTENPIGSKSQLCFNYQNSLVQKLVSLTNEALIRSSVEMLYVQSLLLGHYPLKGNETRLLSDGLRDLIELSIASES
ncbi:MAG: HSP90 family protein [Planctomycetaceae bacterium]